MPLMGLLGTPSMQESIEESVVCSSQIDFQVEGQIDKLLDH